jgi:putative transposase
MPNHVHMIVCGKESTSMARCLGLTHMRYARRVNERNGWTGHLWANRFYSTPVDDEHLWAAVRYVELNPVRAGIVTRPTEYPWSSARGNALRVADALLDPDRPFPGSIDDWEPWLMAGVDDKTCDALRRCTLSGRPCGSAAFARDVEVAANRALATRKRGRRPRLTNTEGRPRLID